MRDRLNAHPPDRERTTTESAEPNDAVENGLPEKGSERGSSPNLVTVAAVVATGIGALGWVTFVGGAILWISFRRAGVPQSQAVAKVPTSVLIATGAEFVVAALAAAVIIIGLLYLFEDRVVDLLRRAFDLLRGALSSRPLLAVRRPVEFGFMPAALLALTAIGAAMVVDLGYGALPAGGYVVVILVAVFAGLVGAALNRQTHRQTDTVRFSVIGLVALIAVPLVMGVGAYFRTQSAPRVEPVALLKADGTPFVGFFLAETTDRVFVGTFEEKAPDPCATIRRSPCETDAERVKVPAQLLSLPASEVRNLTVGPTMPLNADDAVEGREGPRTAREWAGSAALILCEAARTARSKAEVRLADGTESALLPATCSEEDVDKLTAFLETEQGIVDDGTE